MTVMDTDQIQDYKAELSKYSADPTVVAVAKEFIRTWYEADCFDSIEACHTVRRVLSDALRDAGCGSEWVHERVIDNYGLMAAERILEDLYGRLTDWNRVKAKYGEILFDEEVVSKA